MLKNTISKKTIICFILFQISSLSIFAQWTKVGETISGGTNSAERFGRAISLSADGNTLAIGAYKGGTIETQVFGTFTFDINNEEGVVRIYEKNASDQWIETTEIIGSDNSDHFGRSLALTPDGNYLVVGSYAHDAFKGTTRVYKKNASGDWTQIGSDIDGENTNEYSGWSVSISDNGSTVAIGGYNNSLYGTYTANSEISVTRVYQLTPADEWLKVGTDITDITTDGDGDGASISLSADGTIVAVGAPRKNNNKGATRIYENQSGTWTQIGNDIDGETDGELAGWSVSLSDNGTTVAVGAYLANSQDGAARIYENQSGTWTKVTQIDGTTGTGENFGNTLYLTPDANTVVIGAPAHDNFKGLARVFKKTASGWNQTGDDIESGATSIAFSATALSLSDDGNTVAVGAYATNFNDGMTQVYHIDPSTLSIDETVTIEPGTDYTIENHQVTINNRDLELSIFDLSGRIQNNHNLNGTYILVFANILTGKTSAIKIHLN